MPGSRLWWAALVLAALGIEGAAGQTEPGPLAPRVVAVELRSDAPLKDPQEVRDLVSIEVGEPLSSVTVRQTLRNLQASGLVAEAEVWTEPAAGGGVRVLVALWGNVLVDEIRLDGELELRRPQVRRVVVQRAGQPLVEDRILRSVFALQDLYRSEGFLVARARARIDTDEARRRAVVTFEIEAGEPTLVGAIELPGLPPGVDAPKLRERLRSRPGHAYRETTAREDTERLSDGLRELGYLEADVELVPPVGAGTGEPVSLVFRVEGGTRYQLRAEGASLDQLRKQKLLPFLEEGFDDVLLIESEQLIRRFFQQKGHHEVAVDFDLERQPESTLLTVRVELGPRVALLEVEFRGNQEVSAERLQKLLTTAPRSRFAVGSGRLIDEVVEDDLANVRSFYALGGWGQAVVGPPEIEEVAPGELRLVVPIAEGPRARVVDLTVIGAEAIPQAELLSGLPLVPGGPFHPLRREEAVAQIRARYETLGYAEAEVTSRTDWNADRTLVDVEIRVHEGTQRRLERVIIRGLRHTDVDVVRGVAGLVPGEPLNQARRLEVQRRLYRLGVFSRASVDLAPRGDAADRRDVVLHLTEGQVRRVSYGLGYDSQEEFGGLASYSHANLWGQAFRFQLDLRASQRSERYRLLLSRPFWGSGSIPGGTTLTLSQMQEDRPSFSVEQIGGQWELARDRGKWRFSLFFSSRESDLTLDPDVVLETAGLPSGQEGRDLQDIRLFSLTPRVLWDGRDNPVDPHRGIQLSLQAERALPSVAGADQDFIKLFGQYAQYWPLGRYGVLASSVRLGAIEARGEEPVAISERFFAGGRTTHRAYDLDELGNPGETIDSEGNPIGGLGMVLANFDWRFPIAGGVGGTVFVDAGNVWPEWNDARSSELKLGAGLGVRYQSPVGPLRLEMGWKLDREPGESPYEIFFSLGNAF